MVEHSSESSTDDNPESRKENPRIPLTVIKFQKALATWRERRDEDHSGDFMPPAPSLKSWEKDRNSPNNW